MPIDQLERNILIYILNKSSCLTKSKNGSREIKYFLGIQVRDGSDLEF